MKNRIRIIFFVGMIVMAFTAARLVTGAETNPRLDAEKIGQAAGAKATATPDGVVRVAWARTDVPVTVDGMRLHPFAGLGSWAAFESTQHGAMVMGDTVVFQDEVTPAMEAAFAAGLEVTALHNHFFYDEPPLYFTHFWGKGSPEKLAKGIKAALDQQANGGGWRKT